MKQAIIIRAHYGENQTLGVIVCLENGIPKFTLCTLELPDKNNQPKISCIPKGKYVATLMDSQKFGKRGFYKVTTPEGGEVPGRVAIGIHRGNFNTDILGCILVGKLHQDANKDGYLDAVNSTQAFAELTAWADKFEFEIK